MEEKDSMIGSKRDKDAHQPRESKPTPHDPVVSALRQAEGHYREIYRELEDQTAEAERELARAREDQQRSSQALAARQLELEEERRRAERAREKANTLAAALNEIHRQLFSGNIYGLILKTCITLTGATRGLYITTSGEHEALHVRAAVDVDNYPTSPPSPFITGLCRSVLRSGSVFTRDDLRQLKEQPGEGEVFRNFIAAPVVLRGDVSGVVVVADKTAGEFDQEDTDVLLSVGAQAGVAIENARMEREVHEAYLSIVTVLAKAMAARNPQAEPSQESACRYARLIAERLGESEYLRSIVYYAALLHDVGNIGVSDGVLNKPGLLMDAERELIRAHVQIGYDLLRAVPLLEPVAQVVRHHHERYDGSGYPDGLKGDAIPIAARIVAVVDAYGAMLAARSYRPALRKEQACHELRRGAGTQFDPRVVDIFLAELDSPAADVDRDAADLRLPGLDVGHARLTDVHH
jgi:HD-GYP domain-containing protein (c-di-GMP phosphodiesterase class II)